MLGEGTQHADGQIALPRDLETHEVESTVRAPDGWIGLPVRRARRAQNVTPPGRIPVSGAASPSVLKRSRRCEVSL